MCPLGTFLTLTPMGRFSLLSRWVDTVPECSPLEAPGAAPITLQYSDFSTAYEQLTGRGYVCSCVCPPPPTPPHLPCRRDSVFFEQMNKLHIFVLEIILDKEF